MGRMCITLLWATLTMLFTTGIAFAMLSPVWFENMNLITRHGEDRVVSFGIIRYCVRHELNDVIQDCSYFSSFDTVPNAAWLVSSIAYVLGVLLFTISAVLAIVLSCVSRKRGNKLKIAAAYVQAVGVCFLVIAIFAFPLGLDSNFARTICGAKAAMFITDNCQVAWGYVLGIMTVSLTVFCPILARYSIKAKHNKADEDDELTDFEYRSDSVSLTMSSTSKVMTTV